MNNAQTSRPNAEFAAIHIGTPGRTRYRVAGLHRNAKLAAAMEIALAQVSGIANARANPMTGTLLVRFSPGLARSALERAIAAALATAHAAPESTAKPLLQTGEVVAVQVVCLDKTGTITLNRMTVVAAQAGLGTFAVSRGTFVAESGRKASPASSDIEALLRIAVLCNEVELEEDHGQTVLKGSPTEGALIELARAAGLDVRALRLRNPVIATRRRSEERNYMSTLHAVDGKRMLAVKGRPSDVLALSSRSLRNGEVAQLDEANGSVWIERGMRDGRRRAGRRRTAHVDCCHRTGASHL